MNKIKILFFIPQLVGGGAEKVNMNIIKLLDKKIFEVHLVVSSLKGSVYSSLPEDIIFHNLKSSKTIYAIPKLRKIVLNVKPDILFSSLMRGHIALYLSLLGIQNLPYIIFRSPNSPKLLIENNQIGNIQRLLVELAYDKADLVLAQTPEMKIELNKYHKIPEEKIEVMLNPIDADNIEKSIKNIQNPFKEKNINIIAAGRITYQKGFDILIKSFVEVVKHNSLCMLYIIGQNIAEEQEKLQSLVEELHLSNNIIFLGYQSNPYKYYYYSDLYVLSSRWEGLPNTVLENLYLKKPIVSTKCIPYMESLIDNGNTGYLVDVDDINGLAKSILNFRNLKLNFSKQESQHKVVNEFFEKRILL